MRYAMKQKLFCLGDVYRIRRHGRDVATVSKKLFTLAND